MDNKKTNLFKALGHFIKAMRLFIPTEMVKRFGSKWEEVYYNALSDRQKLDWDNQTNSGQEVTQLIDFGNLGTFVLRRKDFFEPFFGRGVNKLPTMFFDIAEARNMTAHFDSWDDDLAESTYLNMIRISKALEMDDLVTELRKLRKKEVSTLQGEVSNPPSARIKDQRELNKTSMGKNTAINIINKKLTLKLNSNNTNWSNINANDIWSIEPNLERKQRDLHLILNNNKTKKMHVFKIPANHEIYEKLYVRNDKSVFRLIFNLSDTEFIETLKQINFRNYYIDTITYSDNQN